MICDRFQLADVFGVHPESVRNWCRQGCPVHQEPKTGKGVSNEEKKRLFDTAAVHQWLVMRALLQAR